MTKQNENKNIPELRFPEFKDDGEWEERKLEEVTEINPTSSKLPNEFVYVDLESVENGVLLQKKVISKDGAPSRAQRLLRNEDIIFQMVRPYQKNNYYFKKNDNLDYVASTGYAQLRVFESSMYLYQFLHTDNFVSRVLSKCTGSNYPAINSSDLSNILIQIPKPKEQQKIADCLSYLDEVIVAHSDKLKVLKDHKKGLMQVLFPVEGEKVPRCRFPEFKDHGEWDKEELGNVISYFKGFPFQSSDYSTSGRRIVRVSDMGVDYIKDEKNAIYIDEDKSKQFEKWSLRRGDLIITTVGSKPPIYDSLVGRTIVVEGKDESSLLNQNAICLRANKEIDQSFLGILFKGEFYIGYIESIIRGNANQGSIALVDLFKYKFLKPQLLEQQKIADTLCSLDDLITAQSEKIEQLKSHKKGLMQKLFPAINE